LEELQAGTGARTKPELKDEIAIGATRARGPQLLAAVSVGVGVPTCPLNCGLLSDDVSALSEARFDRSVTLGEVLCARSIEPFEGGRWRLRWMRANGYGNSIFSPTCKLLVLRYLENEHVREPQFDALRWGMTCGA
jgi:hypothetical protein